MLYAAKIMDIFRNGVDAKLISNKKRLFNMDIQTKLYVTQNIHNNLDVIRKNEVTLTRKKPAYIGMCALELHKVLMYELHYDSIKNIYGNKSKLLFTDNDSLMNEIKTESVYKDFSNDKEMFDIIIQHHQNIMIIKSFFPNDNSKHKKKTKRYK